MYNLFEFVINELQVPHSKIAVKNFGELQPFGNSFFSLQMFLQKYNIATSGIRVINKHDLQQLTVPFVAVWNNSWIVVKNIKENVVFFSMYGQHTIQMNIVIDEFIKEWDGTALAISELTNARDGGLDSYNEKSRFIKDWSIIFCLAIMVTMSIFYNIENASGYTVLFINALGCFISVLLLQRQLHIPNKLSEKICGLVRESHCEKVIESNGATIFGLVKLSEVGFGFFLTNMIYLLISSKYISWLALYSLCVLPFSFWSIWYQKFRAKSWCMLCIFTLFLMWLQAGVYLVSDVFSMLSMNLLYPLMIGTTYVLVVFITNKIMEMLYNNLQGKVWHKRYENIKSNDGVISVFEKDAPVYDTSEAFCSSLLFGNPDAEKTITLFSNPYCQPCAALHNRIKDLPGDCVNIRYVMTYFSEDKIETNKAIIAAYQQLGATKTWEILTEWFAIGQSQGISFFNRFHLNINTNDVEIEFNKQCNWRKDKPIHGTPTEFVNGREIVWPYTVEDYFYL